MEIKSNIKRDWPSIIQEWADSGQTITKFCKTRGLAISGFYTAKNRYGSGKKAKRSTMLPKFVEVAAPLPPYQTSSEPSPTLRITSKDGHVLEVFL